MGLFDLFGKGDKPKPEEDAEETVENAPQMLYARLLFTEKISFDKRRIAAELEEAFDNVEEADNQGNTLLYYFPDYSVQYQDGSVPAQGAIFITEEPTFDAQSVATALTQSWHWAEAAAAVETCKYECLVSDMMSRGLDYKQRAECYQKFLSAIIKATRPQAVHFMQSDKLVEPFAYAFAVSEEEPDVLNGLVNVRFFNIANSPEGEMFLDTLGMHALGLPDFQIRFQEFDPNAVVSRLWSYANYIYENGVVIEPGNTIQGMSANDKWTCYYADAAVEPKRVVIDLETDS
ncbi:DUF4261 domain-containing protein [Hymenobacter crusticola]|uniref:DUF4261 domain-containing protein n=1 Tax=Hymenobacter crusticola TaxID=1770526 RepID=A0A243WCR0_9BACT|nr:DUF4261 domain-containing protein [Hymenobacter crusticola]OUJ73226.1 hypothetical protein BXP70_15480 [Hymenobacter crusticola]